MPHATPASGPRPRRSILARLGAAAADLPPPLRRLAALQAAMNAAHFAAMPMLAVLILNLPGATAADAGTALAVYFALARGGPLLVGPLADRFGLWRALVAGLALRGAALVVLPFLPGGAGALIACALLGLGQASYESGAYGIMGAQPRASRDRLLVLNGQALNLGCVVGPLAGAGLALADPRLAFLGAGGLLLGLAAWCGRERSAVLRIRSDEPIGGSLRALLRDGRFLLLCAALVPFWALFAQLFAAFPILMARLGGATAWAGGVLFLNGLTGIAALALVGPWIARGRVVRMLVVGLAVASAAVLATTTASSLLVLMLVVVAFSVGESFVMAASDILTAEHADGRSPSTFFGLLNAAAGLGAAIGGLVGASAAASGDLDGVVPLALGGLASILLLGVYVRTGKAA